MTGVKAEPLDGVLSHKLFPGRTRLYVHEVASALQITANHVVTLILEGLLAGTVADKSKKITSQDHWRVTTKAYDAFIRRRQSCSRRRASRVGRK